MNIADCGIFFLHSAAPLKVQKRGYYLESVCRGRKVDNPVLPSALKHFEACYNFLVLFYLVVQVLPSN